jgi:hypothetical protein
MTLVLLVDVLEVFFRKLGLPDSEFVKTMGRRLLAENILSMIMDK